MKFIFAVLGLALIWQGAHAAETWMTQYDQQFTFECDKNLHLTAILSVHDSRKEDRVFNFSCDAAPDVTELQGCEWSGYVNNFDQLVEYQCPNEGILTGVDSVHSNRNEDRRFKFRCCQPAGMWAHSCQYTDFINSYDGMLNYTVPDGMVMHGISSIHSNDKEDRIFRFDICKLDLAVNSFQGPGIGR